MTGQSRFFCVKLQNHGISPFETFLKLPVKRVGIDLQLIELISKRSSWSINYLLFRSMHQSVLCFSIIIIRVGDGILVLRKVDLYH